MRDDFCVFILTHGRPDNVKTYNSLQKHGYTGKVYFVIDDEDATADVYRETFGEENVLQFCKKDVAATFDEADTFNDRRTIVYARNVCFSLARQVGCRYFIELDDDYNWFGLSFNQRREYQNMPIKDLDAVLTLMLDWFIACPRMTTLCMSQGGDHLGGGAGSYAKTLRSLRKAMNSFICDTERPFSFQGRINEDVNTYTEAGRRGALFMTTMQVKLTQALTQASDGGMSDIYRLAGTYVKSFYTLLFCPSSVKIAVMGSPQNGSEGHYRIHHRVDWRSTVPVILREDHRKRAGFKKKRVRRR
jgi:hypothetical protein